MRTATKAERAVNDLFDYATRRPEGFSRDEALDALGISHPDFNKAVNGVRRILAGDDIQLTCDPNGLREQWTYRLVGTAEKGGPWVDNRLRDSRARFMTLRDFTQSLVNATDGRTKDGRQAREMHMAAKHLLERLDLIEETL